MAVMARRAFDEWGAGRKHTDMQLVSIQALIEKDYTHGLTRHGAMVQVFEAASLI